MIFDTYCKDALMDVIVSERCMIAVLPVQT